jgi:hypothetical protein
MAISPGRRFYEEQIAYISNTDVDGLVEAHYRDDALPIGFDVTVKCRPALKEYLQGYLRRLGDFRLKSTDRFSETEDAIFFEATVVSNLGEARVYDAMVLRDGEISHHFTGVISQEAAPSSGST